MKKGEVALLTIAPEYAFCSSESRDELVAVRPNSSVYYEVELVSFDKAVKFTTKESAFEMVMAFEKASGVGGSFHVRGEGHIIGPSPVECVPYEGVSWSCLVLDLALWVPLACYGERGHFVLWCSCWVYPEGWVVGHRLYVEGLRLMDLPEMDVALLVFKDDSEEEKVMNSKGMVMFC
ncbi:hypothetical protein LIER_32227 [Lithospermum erythrorhizon]|uniref:peptidylprolyl isomerase n=1 Tax=Lithospermum erythrorhizon TaxID=34254 RepID=A0AAV3RWW4_LITER